MMNFFLLFVGIVLLTGGGELLIRGALGISNRLGVSALLSGLLIVGFGTSMPEMVVSVDASLQGLPDIAIGNVVGSNIANVMLILGLCAVITPLSVSPSALRRDALVVILGTVLFIGLAWQTGLSRVDAGILLLALVGYLVWAYVSERGQASEAGAVHKAEASEIDAVPASLIWSVMLTLLGLALLIAGSQFLLKGAVGIALQWKVSEALIGLTLVSVGTSLPELTITVIAALRRHADVAVGNVLGSNIFNLLGILGISALVQPLTVSQRIFQFDQWVMLGVAGLLYLFLYSSRRLSRLEGSLLLGGYVAYLWLSFVGAI
ncbi:calcium/sodium antiporter [Reinekea blandensis]|uniref:K+-dependent Na+/Ca+ exchanger related-protein n=1 Tax=Reinekea blandensis MED297 TaxID=314283 RepID=A4BKA1_9GAMM|nr:K+-dependent Na+/Ca+ exchanger related-protein [Reinekea sp. MED297] [Reinekea blandensis MED297]